MFCVPAVLMAVTAVTAAHHELGPPKAVVHSQQQPGPKSARPGSRDSNYCTNWEEQAQRAAQAALWPPCMLPAPQTESLSQPLFTALWSCAAQGADKEQLENAIRYQTVQLQASPTRSLPTSLQCLTTLFHLVNAVAHGHCPYSM